MVMSDEDRRRLDVLAQAQGRTAAGVCRHLIAKAVSEFAKPGAERPMSSSAARGSIRHGKPSGEGSR